VALTVTLTSAQATSVSQVTPAPELPGPGPATGPLPALPAVQAELILHGSRSLPWVALTFDACQQPDQERGYDAEIVRILTETHTPATFFLGGLWMQSHPTQTLELARVPYFELGNHSWGHPDFEVISEAEMSDEITRTQEIMYRLVGRQPTLFRFPFGTYRQRSIEVVAEHGLKAIQWDVVTGDPDPNIMSEDIARVVRDHSRYGSIVIMHVNGRGWHTAEALPSIIETLSERGFRFVTISELLAGAEADPQQPGVGNATVVVERANLRGESTTESATVGALWQGERVNVLCAVAGQDVPPYATDVWYRIQWGDAVAYVLSALIDPDGEVEVCQP
jgi:peptidoglycan/xylan/chitin deacetylase (PgdA/CDA1 family)